MANRLKNFEKDTRSSLRVKEDCRVTWQTDGGQFVGLGRVHNISSTGMLLETNSNFSPEDGAVFSFDSVQKSKDYIPRVGRLVWYEKKKNSRDHHLCGVEFIAPTDDIKARLDDRIVSYIRSLAAKENFVWGLECLMVAAILSLTAFVIWQSSLIYSNLDQSTTRLLNTSAAQARVGHVYQLKYREATDQLAVVTNELASIKALYQESQTMLTGITTELNETKNVLAQTESMLAQARKDLDETKVTSTQAKVELENTIGTLEGHNKELSSKIQLLEEQVRLYSGDIRNVQEGRNMLTVFKAKAKVIRARIKSFQQEVQFMKQQATQERDRIRMSLGNNGYFVKNGAVVVVDEERYRNATVLPKTDNRLTPSSASTPNVAIDVQIVE